MRISMNEPLRDFEGRVLELGVERRDKEGRIVRDDHGQAVMDYVVATFGWAARNAIATDVQDDKPDTDEKIKRAALAQRLFGDLDLTIQEAALIRERAGKVLTTQICAQVAALLERAGSGAA